MEWVVAGLLIVLAAAVLWFVAHALVRRSRYARLLAKYGDVKVVDAIVSGTIWQGMTSEQLREAWGDPVSVEEKVLKTKVKQVFKYQKVSRNRFRDKVMLEDDVVIGWDQK
jgi:predicted protein tyrosine phosphatase